MEAGKRTKNQGTAGFNYKDEDIFVIEDEDNVTLEDNNQPVKINQKIQMIKKHLSSPGPFAMRKVTSEEDEDMNRSKHDASNFEVRHGADMELDTERDAI